MRMNSGMTECCKILEREGVLDLYRDYLTDKGRTMSKSLYPKNNYSSLNSLRARLINCGWDGMNCLFNNSDVSINAYLTAILNGQEHIDAPSISSFIWEQIT